MRTDAVLDGPLYDLPPSLHAYSQLSFMTDRLFLLAQCVWSVAFVTCFLLSFNACGGAGSV